VQKYKISMEAENMGSSFTLKKVQRCQNKNCQIMTENSIFTVGLIFLRADYKN